MIWSLCHTRCEKDKSSFFWVMSRGQNCMKIRVVWLFAFQITHRHEAVVQTFVADRFLRCERKKSCVKERERGKDRRTIVSKDERESKLGKESWRQFHSLIWHHLSLSRWVLLKWRRFWIVSLVVRTDAGCRLIYLPSELLSSLSFSLRRRSKREKVNGKEREDPESQRQKRRDNNWFIFMPSSLHWHPLSVLQIPI